MPGDLVFLHSGFMPRCTATVDKHLDDYYSLQLATAGEVELFYDVNRHLLHAPIFWTAYPGPHIRFSAHGAWWTHRYAAFSGSLLARWTAQGLWFHEPQPMPQGVDLTPLFDDLLATLKRTDRLSALRGVNLLERLLIELAAARQTRPIEPWLDLALLRLDPEASQAPDYAALAHEMGMGLSTLRRRFKDATGHSPHDYWLQTRIARARELLGEGDLPIKAVAEKLGYSDVFFFSSQFRRFTGTTPAAFRRSRQA